MKINELNKLKSKDLKEKDLTISTINDTTQESVSLDTEMITDDNSIDKNIKPKCVIKTDTDPLSIINSIRKNNRFDKSPGIPSKVLKDDKYQENLEIETKTKYKNEKGE